MPRILIVECMQEISSFNPLPSAYENFHIERGEELLAQRGLNTAIGGALSVFEARSDVTIVPAYRRAGPGAPGCSRPPAGSGCRARSWPPSPSGSPASTASTSRSTAPWGRTASSTRKAISSPRSARLAGPAVPIVISLDLHGILTDRMLRQIDGLAIYHTYPHVDFADTGARAASFLLKLLDGAVRPVHGAGRHPGAGARRRAHHQDRLLRRPHPRMPAPGARTARRSRPGS